MTKQEAIEELRRLERDYFKYYCGSQLDDLPDGAADAVDREISWQLDRMDELRWTIEEGEGM